ncbi:putative F-box protein At2g02030 [Silene latifolia]|uniref:putative F-box protein At2g02030 n=1 Tax=Silene latifolia TaxID=37657 RepID=UPI003D778CA7
MNNTCFKSEDIPEEILIDILSRLPPESLSKCKSVSKHWNDTLIIQAFMLKHSRSYDKHSKLAFVAHRPFNEKTSVLSFDLSNRTSSRTMEIIGHRDRSTDTLFDNYICNDMSNICNELVCLFNQFSTRVGLLNIRTHEFIHLPAVTIQRLGPGILGPSIFLYALGYDPVSKVYKVLSIYGGRYVCRTKAAIFTLGSKHWKPVEYKFLNCWRCNNKLCLDGVIYWVNDNQIDGAKVVTVVAFDLNRELFIDYELDSIPYNKAIALSAETRQLNYYLSVSGESLGSLRVNFCQFRIISGLLRSDDFSVAIIRVNFVTVNWRYWRSNDSFCLDGVIYWADDNEINGNLTVVGFDLYHEVFRDYKLDTISIKDDVDTIKYYLTSLKGNLTLFIWRKESDEIQRLTLFNHKNPTVAWNKKSIIAHDFPKKFPYGCRRTCVAGGSILLA